MFADHFVAERSKPSWGTASTSSAIVMSPVNGRGRTVESHAVIPPFHPQTSQDVRRLPGADGGHAYSQRMPKRWTKIRELPSNTKDELESLESWVKLGQS
jgi:hypothetical protein